MSRKKFRLFSFLYGFNFHPMFNDKFDVYFNDDNLTVNLYQIFNNKSHEFNQDLSVNS